jgi:two-component system sensor histidine kinase YesM
MIQKMWKRVPFIFLANSSMEKKLITVFIFLIILPISITSYIAYQSYSKSIMNNTKGYVSQLSDKIMNRLDEYITDMEQISQMPLYLTPMQELLEKNDDDLENFSQQQYQMDNYIRILNDMKKGTNSIYIFDKKERTYLNIKIDGVRPDLGDRMKDWIAKAQKANGEPVLVSTQELTVTTKNKYVFSVLREIKDIYTHESLGTIVVDANISVIQQIIKDLDSTTHGKTLIIDQTNNVIYDSEEKRIAQNIENDQVVLLSSGEEGSFVYNSHTKDYLATYAKSAKTGWKIIITIPIAEITKEATRTRNVMLVVIGSIIAFAMIISILFSFALTNPLKKLMRLMKKAEKGDLNISFNVLYQDEVGRLGSHFNSMIGRIKDLIHDVYVSETRKKEAEMEALQSQINPHFIYNTLETIRMTAEINDDGEVSEMITSLGKLLRYSINTKMKTAKVAQEVEHLQNYMQMFNYRYKDKYELIVDPFTEIENIEMIKLIFQPIVENAILHGRNEREQSKMISLTYEIMKNSLIFRIKDNGMGIEGDKLKALNAHLNGQLIMEGANNGLSIGLTNVNERIKMHYGSLYGIEILSQFGQGTEVVIRLPYKPL